ncbi:hypothetical protein BGZ90_012222 [Linnemannia elongata]|nr:hypothetical protein BGZ90_012222 [Linnemannia elongata]
MADKFLSLFCLVEGQSTSNAFSVKPTLTDTVGDLKDLIKAKKTIDFIDVDANNLTLWRVFIPVVPNKERKAISVAEVPWKEELDDMDDLSDVFKETPPPKKTVHLKSVPKEYIGQELAVIIQGAQHHPITSTLNPLEAEASQIEMLGRFFKRTLPCGETARDIKLVMLGLELDRQAKESDGMTTLRSIVEKDIGKLSRNVVTMVAPSGSGKTATVVDLATKHFVVYCVCCSTQAIVSPKFEDPNFAQLAHDVEEIYATVARTQGVAQGALDVESEARLLVGLRVQLEFLARFLFLQLLLDRNPDLEPQQFFREQTAVAGASTIHELVKALRKYDSLAIQYMLDDVQTKLHDQLEPRRRGLVIALDEAQVAENLILAGKFISQTGLAAYWNPSSSPSVLFDAKHEIHRHYRRGFLKPLSATLSRMQATLVILGTALLLQDPDQAYPAVGKETNFTRITGFLQLDESDVSKMISDLVDMSECEIPRATLRKLSGRARFSLGIINYLLAAGSTQENKQDILMIAVDQWIKEVKLGLRGGVRVIFANDHTGEASRLLCRMVLANHRQEHKVALGLEAVTKGGGGGGGGAEVLTAKASALGVCTGTGKGAVVISVEEELQYSNKDPAFIEYMDQLTRLIENLGATSATKGEALEMLVRRSLQRFNSVPVVDLPFLKGLHLPAWCARFRIQVDEINTVSGFGYKGSGVTADLAFLTDCPPSKMLVAQSSTHSEGVWFFPEKEYIGSLAIKFYSNCVSQDKHKEKETSSDVRACFLQAGDDTNPILAATRHAYVNTGTPSNVKGNLRIHLEFPRVQGVQSVTHVRKDLKTGIEDVMVYINCQNMDSFFDESIEAHKDDMSNLKKLIKYVTAA